jgi:hypothetical protein
LEVNYLDLWMLLPFLYIYIYFPVLMNFSILIYSRGWNWKGVWIQVCAFLESLS